MRRTSAAPKRAGNIGFGGLSTSRVRSTYRKRCPKPPSYASSTPRRQGWSVPRGKRIVSARMRNDTETDTHTMHRSVLDGIGTLIVEVKRIMRRPLWMTANNLVLAIGLTGRVYEVF